MRQHIVVLLKWWWLLLLAALATGVTAYQAARPLPPVYLARATLTVGRAISDPNPSGNDIGLSQQLAAAYADLAGRDPIQAATRAALGIERLPDYTARANGTFVEIAVTHSDPQLAQAVANELANQLILNSPSNPRQVDRQRQAFVEQQLAEQQQHIAQAKNDIAAKQNALSHLTGAVEIANAQNDLVALQAKLIALESNYANLIASSPAGVTNILSLFEAASLPTIPIGPNKPLIVGLAAVCGLLLAAGGAYVLEMLDTSVKTADEIARLLPYPVIGHISEAEWGKKKGLAVAQHPRSATAEAFRTLRTNIEFSAVERPIRTLLVTSVNPGDGKTFVAASLAFMTALADRKVVLLDADLRKPSVHQVFQLSNAQGLGEIFLGTLSVANAINPWPAQDNLGVITAGAAPPNPTELIDSQRMDDILVQLADAADVVILDSGPILVADSSILAAKVDAVLLIVRPGRVNKAALRAVQEQIRRSGARVAGVVLNRMPRDASHYYMIQRSSAADRAPRLPVPAVFSRPGPDRQTQASLELLQALTRLSAESLGTDEAWKRLLDLTRERMGAASGSILLFDEGGQVVDGAVAFKGKVRGEAGPALNAAAQGGLAGWVSAQRLGALVPNTLEDPRWLRQPWEESQCTARSAISVPIVTAGRVTGVLTLAHTQTGYFSEDDLVALTAAATWAGVSGRFAAQPSPRR